jgi:protein-disulfide isomerase
MRLISTGLKNWARGLVVVLSLAAPGAGRPVSASAFEWVKAEGVVEIVKDPGVYAVGAAHPAVWVVEYFDYNCPYCKRQAPELQALVRANAEVGVFYKDWPILGETSVYAARSAIAAGWQGKYALAHDALITGPRCKSHDDVDATLQAAGIDMNELAQARVQHANDIAELLARNDNEARGLGLHGTPGILVGRRLLGGLMDAETLKSYISKAHDDR